VTFHRLFWVAFRHVRVAQDAGSGAGFAYLALLIAFRSFQGLIFPNEAVQTRDAVGLFLKGAPPGARVIDGRELGLTGYGLVEVPVRELRDIVEEVVDLPRVQVLIEALLDVVLSLWANLYEVGLAVAGSTGNIFALAVIELLNVLGRILAKLVTQHRAALSDTLPLYIGGESSTAERTEVFGHLPSHLMDRIVVIVGVVIVITALIPRVREEGFTAGACLHAMPILSVRDLVLVNRERGQLNLNQGHVLLELDWEITWGLTQDVVVRLGLCIVSVAGCLLSVLSEQPLEDEDLRGLLGRL
jgi:hypothetical protein